MDWIIDRGYALLSWLAHHPDFNVLELLGVAVAVANLLISLVWGQGKTIASVARFVGLPKMWDALKTWWNKPSRADVLAAEIQVKLFALQNQINSMNRKG